MHPITKAFCIFGTGALLGCSHSTPRSLTPLPFPIIDAHIHTDFTNQPESYTQIPYSKDELIKEMKQNGVIAAISHAEDGNLVTENLNNLRIFHCYGIREGFKTANLEKALKAKQVTCVKIYLGYVHKFAADSFYLPAYRLAEKYHVPVVFHTGDTYSEKAKLKYADPLTVDEVAVDFPAVKFVIAHAGNPWIQSAAEVTYKNPNVYLEGSAILIGDLSKSSEEEIDELMVKPLHWAFLYVGNPRKFLFGTDWPLNHIGPYVDAFKRAIPEKYWKDVFYNNALSVFEIPDLKPIQ